MEIAIPIIAAVVGIAAGAGGICRWQLFSDGPDCAACRREDERRTAASRARGRRW